MTSPTSFTAPLRRVVISKSALAEAFRAFSKDNIFPDLRCNAFGLGIEEVSAIAESAGCRQARLSNTDLRQAGVDLAPLDSPSSTSWLTNPGVLAFEAEVVSIKQVVAGARVSYGYKYTTSVPTALALVGVGFADGVPRSAGASAKIAIGKALYPVAGVIAMDQLVVDCGNADIQVGDVATIWGSSPSLANWSDWSGRPAEMLVSRLNGRVVTVWT